MNCNDFREEIDLYVLGALEPAAVAKLEEHLGTGCEKCQEEVRQAALQNAAFLTTLTTPLEPPATLRQRVLESVGAAAPRRRIAWFWPVAAAALLLTTLTLGVRDWQRSVELRELASVAQQDAARLAELREALTQIGLPATRPALLAPGAQQPPSGKVFVNPSRGVVLVAANLPALPAERTYAMWVITPGNAPQPAGLFRPDERGLAVHLYAQQVAGNTQAVAVSVEPRAGSPAPTTTPILVAPL